jgi:hypothetical protein
MPSVAVSISSYKQAAGLSNQNREVAGKFASRGNRRGKSGADLKSEA